MKKLKNKLIINLPGTVSGLLNDYANGLLSKTSFTHILDRIVREYNDRQYMYRLSKKAMELLCKDNINLNMTNKQFDTKYRKKYNLVQEHLEPIKQLSEKLCNATLKLETLLSNSEVCWILQSEHVTLENNGYKSSRPNGWEDAYKQCGIETETIKHTI